MKPIMEYAQELHDRLKANYELWVKSSGEQGDKYLANYYTFLRRVVDVRINKESKDAVIAMTGPKGEGKSNGSLCGALVQSHMLSALFDLAHNVVYSYNLSSATKLIVSSRKQVYVHDEAVDSAFNQDAIQRINKFFAKVFIKGRKLGHIYYLNMPKMWMFGSLFKSDIIHFKIEFIKLFDNFSLVALMAPDKNPLNRDPWFMDDDDKNYRKKRAMASGYHSVMRILEKHPTFVCFMKIPKIPAVLFNKYEEQSFISLEELGGKAETLEQDTRPKKKENINNGEASPI
jgi:hypothetical protein